MDLEIRHFDFDQAYLLAESKTDMYVDLPEEYREFPGAVGKLNKAIYDLV